MKQWYCPGCGSGPHEINDGDQALVCKKTNTVYWIEEEDRDSFYEAEHGGEG